MSMQCFGRTSYHDYEGIALDLDERDRLVRNLGDNNAMILRHHGLLTTCRTVADAFYEMYYLEQACRLQVAARAVRRLCCRRTQWPSTPPRVGELREQGPAPLGSTQAAP
jgi:ribulose-5-phosphate 4-epimerase/fuculose-1-phosphate aldolase